MQLARFPRVRLCHRPTPLEPLPNLTRLLGGPELWVKRDDCTGLAGGGNKTRKLDFLLGAARAEGADTIITLGAVQSNHARQTAAAAARLGLAAELLLARRVASPEPGYEDGGNVLIDRLVGAILHLVDPATDLDSAALALAEAAWARGAKPYLIPVGGSNATGALGYVECARELLVQADELGLVIDHVVHASSSGGTQAGLVAGLAALHAAVAVLGVSVDGDAAGLERRVRALAEATMASCGLLEPLPPDAVSCSDAYAGPAYGVPTEDTLAAIGMAARAEGLPLDPVYTGKAMAGLIDLVRRGHFRRGEVVVFLHTGGLPSLFAHGAALGTAVQ